MNNGKAIYEEKRKELENVEKSIGGSGMRLKNSFEDRKRDIENKNLNQKNNIKKTTRFSKNGK